MVEIQNRRLTTRAPDAGDSAAISSSFLRLSIFLVGRLRRPRPSAGNANRWAHKFKIHVRVLHMAWDGGLKVETPVIVVLLSSPPGMLLFT